VEANLLLDLSGYSDYANQMVLAEASKLDQTDLRRQVTPSHGSVWNLLLHMLVVESFYLHAAQGRNGESDNSSPISLPDVTLAWDLLASERRAYIASLVSGELGQATPFELGGSTLTLPRYQLLLQGITHSQHHRGELSVVMTELGYPLPTLDCIIFFVRESGQTWPYE
jgi:uncharacterized damage-inducible protein DinB